MSKIKKGIFIDFYKGHNFGDDLFVHILLHKFPTVGFNVYLDQSYDTFIKHYHNLSNFNNLFEKTRFVLSSKKKDGILNDVASRSRATVLIGGSLFIEPNLPTLNNHLFNSKKPLFIMGSNFGPYTSEKYYEKCKEYFQNATDICFRDEYSFRLFNLKNIRVAPDIAFSMPMVKSCTKNRECFISVVNYNKNHKSSFEIQKNYEKFLLNIIDTYLGENESVTLAGFCPNEGDMEVITRLVSQLPQDKMHNVSILKYDNNIEEITKAISNSSVVVGTRFHSIVLGLSAGKLVLPISYSIKTDNLLKDLGLSKYCVNIGKIKSLKFKKTMLCNLDNKKILELRKKSNLQFKAFESYINAKDRMLKYE